jgi:hypothetical protein
MTPKDEEREKLATASAFVRAMQKRFQARVPDLHYREAIEYALIAMEQTEQDIGPFGCAEGEWTLGAANDLVDEELTYWDA